MGLWCNLANIQASGHLSFKKKAEPKKEPARSSTLFRRSRRLPRMNGEKQPAIWVQNLRWEDSPLDRKLHSSLRP